MELILLSKIENLGSLGDVVKVKSGYARNYLIPYGKAQSATPENIAKIEQRKQELEQKLSEEIAAAKQRLSKIEDTVIPIMANVSPEGKLFGSVGIAEIAAAILESCGEAVEKNEICLPDGPFRELGEFAVLIKLHADVQTMIQTSYRG